MGKPTLDMYGFILAAYEHFNRELFDGLLPQVLLTFQREKRVYGYFSVDRWAKADGQRTHEISINPMYFFTHHPLELYQTIVHEMCHLWQHEFGNPSRSGYHNKEWADKMENIGLMPSHTGEPGGRKTGQKMGDYALVPGPFYRACISFFKSGHALPYVDTHYPGSTTSAQIRNFSFPEHMTISSVSIDASESGDNVEALSEEDLVITDIMTRPFSDHFDIPSANEDSSYQQMAAKKAKVCYSCPKCGIKLWGKPDLLVLCGKCSISLTTSE